MSTIPYEVLQKTLQTYESRQSFYNIMFETVVLLEKAHAEDVYDILGNALQILSEASFVLYFSAHDNILKPEFISEHGSFDIEPDEGFTQKKVSCPDNHYDLLCTKSVHKIMSENDVFYGLAADLLMSTNLNAPDYSDESYLICFNNCEEFLGLALLKYRSGTNLENLDMIKQFVYLMSVMLARNLDKENLLSMYDDIHSAHSELKDTQTQLVHSEKLASIGQLSAGIAHEINNPLGYVKSNVVTLQKYFSRYVDFVDATASVLEGSSADESLVLKYNELLESKKINMIKNNMGSLTADIEDGLERIRKIVLDLKLFARSDTVDVDQELNINEVFESVLSIVWNEIKYKAELVKELSDVPLIKATAQKLGQVFINLIVNAGHAIEEKGLITVRTYHDESYVYADVEDNGAGIPEELRKNIFEPFFTTKESGKGTGMGLSISTDIVSKLGGELLLESQIGKGTVFTIKIPIFNAVGGNE